MSALCHTCGQPKPPEPITTELKVWFMYDCHLFKRVDMSDRDKVFPQLRRLFDEDGCGSLFVRAMPADKTVPALELQSHWEANGYKVPDEEIVSWIKRFYEAQQGKEQSNG